MFIKPLEQAAINGVYPSFSLQLTFTLQFLTKYLLNLINNYNFLYKSILKLFILQ